MKEKTESLSQTSTKTISGCARLYELLSVPPKTSPEINKGRLYPQLVMGTAGFNVVTQPDLSTLTWNKNTNDIVRAMTACELGLFVHPSDQDTYYAAEPEDLQQSKKRF